MNVRFEMALVMQCAGVADAQHFLSGAKLLPTRPRCFASDRYALLTWDHSVPAALLKRARIIIYDALKGDFDTRQIRSSTMCYVRAHQIDDSKHRGDVTVVGYVQTYRAALLRGMLPKKAKLGNVQGPDGRPMLHYGVKVEIPPLMSEVSRESIMKLEGQRSQVTARLSSAELHALLW